MMCVEVEVRVEIHPQHLSVCVEFEIESIIDAATLSSFKLSLKTFLFVTAFY